ncbi:hypothetical protein SAMN05216389_109164 [Oceanobacillus limi]|uniref:Uncharacterized protein n=1 Tax=Oceanobacillus limi TaxID=930131 RepID=A0A1I0DUM8_9BACI|nr:hypothetical protein [Oceanobacillus limi]SET36028.1 hypothetical protein SAMN05216389_109164 [Oceanobacillus limi]
MTNEKKQLKNQLENELQSLHFSSQKEVLDQAYPTTWKQKIAQLWNKEIEIPLLPVSAIVALLVCSYGYKEIHMNDENEKQEKVLVELAGNTYWKDELEREMMKYED